MNRFFRSLAALLCAALLAGACSDDDKQQLDPDAFLTAQPDSFDEVDSKGALLRATVASNRDVSLSVSDAWCTARLLDGKSENNLEIAVQSNPDAEPRTATVTLRAKGCKPLTINIVQFAHGVTAGCELLAFSIERAKNPALTQTIAFTHESGTDRFSARYLKWIEGAEPELMIPTFDFKGVRVQVDGTELVSGVTPVSFADELTLVVEGTNGASKSYTVSLNCPQINRELPVLHLQPASLVNSKEVYVQTAAELYDKTPESTGSGWWNTAENGQRIELRARGNSTWGLPKKPFRMKFPEKFSPIGLDHAKAKSWVLLAQDMDKSLIRTHIAFAYSRVLFDPAEGYHDKAAVLFTPASKFVNVYFTGSYYYSDTGRTEQLKGDYLGVYQMSDQMERDEGRIAVDKLNEKSSDDEISGGYIIETDLHEGNFYSSHGIKMSYKYPKDDECKPEQYTYITQFINQVEEVLYGANFKDPQNGWRKYMDEKTLADFIIVKELAGDLDGYTSTYCYKRRGIDKLFFGPIWDCDKGWNNDRRVPHGQYQPLSSLMINAGFYMPPYIHPDWFHRLWEDENFRAFVGQRWASRRTQLLEATYRELDRMPAAMPKAIEANFAVWPFYYQFSGEANMPAATYDEEIERIRTLTGQRAELLDRLLR